MYKNTLLKLIDYLSCNLYKKQMQSQGSPRITMKFSNLKKFPFKFPSIHKNYIHNKKQIHSSSQKYQLRVTQVKTLKENLYQLSKDNKPGIARQLPLINRRARQFLSERHQFKFLQKYIVADSFCKHGYGPQAVLQFITYYKGIVVNPKKYDIIIKSIVSEAVLKLQKFIIEECKIQVTKIGLDELSLVYNPLLHCRSELRRQDCQILLGLIKAIYGISSMTISEAAGLKLYIDIRQHILNANSAPQSSTSFYPQNKSRNQKMIFHPFPMQTSLNIQNQIPADLKVKKRVQNKECNGERRLKNSSEEEKQFMFSQQGQQTNLYDILDEDLNLEFDDGQELTETGTRDEVICIDK